jgi:hypothetical protein
MSGVWRTEDMGRRISLRIHCRRRLNLAVLLMLALLTAAFLGYLAWGHEEIAASSPQIPMAASAMREYYLTRGTYGGANASTACASGYHMASLWEILDPSNLKYNTTLGQTLSDSGSGPPTYGGWVRTGYSSDNGATAGQANCSNWSTTAGYGTYIWLPNTWDAGWEDMHVWAVNTTTCSNVARVWCVVDEAGSQIFLPLVVRDFS